jgi:hypothetical protein
VFNSITHLEYKTELQIVQYIKSKKKSSKYAFFLINAKIKQRCI